MRKHVDRKLLLSFGLMSAAGGLTGALLQYYAESPMLTAVFGCLLMFTGAMGLTGLSQRLRFHGWMAWVAGFISGMLGGLVGNQGGIRSGAMLGFDVPRHTFVATATAVGVIVDGARMPVYLYNQGSEMVYLWPALLVATNRFVVHLELGSSEGIGFLRAGCPVLTLGGASHLFADGWNLNVNFLAIAIC